MVIDMVGWMCGGNCCMVSSSRCETVSSTAALMPYSSAVRTHCCALRALRNQRPQSPTLRADWPAPVNGKERPWLVMRTEKLCNCTKPLESRLRLLRWCLIDSVPSQPAV